GRQAHRRGDSHRLSGCAGAVRPRRKRRTHASSGLEQPKEEEAMFDFVRIRTRIRALAIVAATAAVSACASVPGAAPASTPVVYHLNEGLPQAQRAIGNIRNHLAAEPSTKIVVVTHGKGIDFLLDGAKNDQGQPFAGAIGELAGRGVEFRVCNNT